MNAKLFGLCAALSVLVLAGPVMAEQPTAQHVKAAREMLRLTEADKMFNGVLPVLLKQQLQLVKQLQPAISPEALERFEVLFVAEAKKGIQKVMDDVAVVYAEALSEEELGEIAAFYKSPVGRKMIEIKPEMAQKAMKIGIAWGQEVGTTVGEKVIEQLKEEGHTF
ncbi:MAG: DUF2059 domain-containing protein [Pseudomonadota bacterium]